MDPLIAPLGLAAWRQVSRVPAGWMWPSPVCCCWVARGCRSPSVTLGGWEKRALNEDWTMMTSLAYSFFSPHVLSFSMYIYICIIGGHIYLINDGSWDILWGFRDQFFHGSFEPKNPGDLTSTWRLVDATDLISMGLSHWVSVFWCFGTMEFYDFPFFWE